MLARISNKLHKNQNIETAMHELLAHLDRSSQYEFTLAEKENMSCFLEKNIGVSFRLLEKRNSVNYITPYNKLEFPLT